MQKIWIWGWGNWGLTPLHVRLNLDAILMFPCNFHHIYVALIGSAPSLKFFIVIMYLLIPQDVNSDCKKEVPSVTPVT